MIDRQTTRQKDEIFTAEGFPAGVYELNFRQKPVLSSLVVLLAVAPIASGIIGIIASPSREAMIVSVVPVLILAGILFAMMAGDQIAGVSVRWLTADFHIPMDTLRQTRSIWANRWASWKDSPHVVRFTGIGLVVLTVLVASVLFGSLAPITIGFMLLPTLIAILLLAGLMNGGKLSRTIYYLRLALTLPPEERAHPCVLIPSPQANRIWLRILVAAILIAFGLALHPCNMTRSLEPTIGGTIGTMMKAAQIGFRFGSILFGPCFLVASAVFAFAGPLIEAHHQRLAPPYGTDCDMSRTLLDGYEERLRLSRNKNEQQSFFHGVHPELDVPILLDEKTFFEHTHVLGPNGSGKSALGIMSRMIQLIRKNNSAVIIIDGKGDNALFSVCKAEADKVGRVFKHFTTAVGRSSYVFNPFESRVMGRFSMSQKVGVLQNALGLVHGDDYGRGFFTLVGNTLLRRAFQEAGSSKLYGKATRTGRPVSINSFRDLHAQVKSVRDGDKDFEAGQQTVFLLEKLAELEQLNLSEGPGFPADHPVLLSAISFPEVIREQQVIYFSMPGVLDPGPTSEIARLAIYSLIASAEQHLAETGRVAPTHVICDEAQMIIGRPIASLLATARAFGVSFLLSHQILGQLNPPGGPDLRETVLGNTATKIIFGARDPFLQKWIRDSSGLTVTADYSYAATLDDVLDGEDDTENAAPGEDGRTLVQVRQSVVPRINIQDIIEISSVQNMCLTTLEVSRGLSQTVSAYPVWIDWPISQDQYEAYQKTPWPEATPETLILRAGDPGTIEETVVETPVGQSNSTKTVIRNITKRARENPFAPE